MKRLFISLVFIASTSLFSLPVGLEVRIFTDPTELYAPHDTYSFMDSAGSFEFTYYIELSNLGDEPAHPCSLLILLPENCIRYYEPEPTIPLPFSLAEHNANRYLFVAEILPENASIRFSIDVILDLSCLPVAVEPPNCATVQADAFLNSPQEHESYTDNTTFCRVVGETTYVDLNIEKEVISHNCSADSIHYRITYSNYGTMEVSDVVIRDILPDYAELIWSEPLPSNSFANHLIWNIPSIPPTASASIELIVSTAGSPRPFNFVNIATIISDSAELSILNNTAEISVFCADTEALCFDLVSEILSSQDTAYPESTLSIYATLRNIGLQSAHGPRVLVEATPQIAIAGQNRWNYSLDTLLSGADTTMIIPLNLRSGCQPTDNLLITMTVTPFDGDCNPANNSSVLSIPYRCPTFCPYPARASTRILTPNGDGFNDVVNFSPSENVKIDIYNTRGILIRRLEGDVSWDGRDKNGQDVEPGIYIWQMFCPSSSIEPHYSGTIAIKR